jgi:hypothetical protein
MKGKSTGMMKKEGRESYAVLKFNNMGDFEGNYQVDNWALLDGEGNASQGESATFRS